MIIGLSGYARSGKDEVAKILIGHFGYQRRALADPIRDALFELNPLIADNMRLQEALSLHGWDLTKRIFPEVRRLLQVFGTEFGRGMISEDVWVELTMRGVRPEDRIVISDIRYPNEAQAVRDLNGQVWRIHRDGVRPDNEHVSENSMEDYEFDVEIFNNGSLDDLLTKIYAIGLTRPAR